MFEWLARLTTPPERFQRISAWLLRLPRIVAFSLVTLLGWTLAFTLGNARATILRNLAEALPDLPDCRRRQLARRYFVEECLTIFEHTFEYRRALSPKGMAQVHFQLEGLSHLNQALRLGKGAIVLTPHIGNYFYTYWWLSRRYHALTVATGGSPELRPLYEGFLHMGCRGLDYDGEKPLDLMRKLRAHLEQGGVLFLLGDFWRPAFPETTLFGKPSRSPSGPAMLGLYAGVPIVPCCSIRDSWSRHRIVFRPAITLQDQFAKHQSAEAMEALNRELEGLIRMAPAQWFYWFNVHERWENERTNGGDSNEHEGENRHSPGTVD